MSDLESVAIQNIIYGNVEINIDISKLNGNIDDAQMWLGNQVATDCTPNVPMNQNGDLRKSVMVLGGGTEVDWRNIYARFQYMGFVMIYPPAGSTWAPRYGKKVVTDRLLEYHTPGTGAHWFETTKESEQNAWIAGVKKIAGGI